MGSWHEQSYWTPNINFYSLSSVMCKIVEHYVTWAFFSFQPSFRVLINLSCSSVLNTVKGYICIRGSNMLCCGRLRSPTGNMRISVRRLNSNLRSSQHETLPDWSCKGCLQMHQVWLKSVCYGLISINVRYMVSGRLLYSLLRPQVELCQQFSRSNDQMSGHDWIKCFLGSHLSENLFGFKTQLYCLSYRRN